MRIKKETIVALTEAKTALEDALSLLSEVMYEKNMKTSKELDYLQNLSNAEYEICAALGALVIDLEHAKDINGDVAIQDID